MKILITGFEPFGGESVNPAYEAVKLLPDMAGDIQIVKMEIPTVFGEAGKVVETGILQHQPDAVICVGQAGRRADIGVERVAINLVEASIPDNAGNQPMDVKVQEDGDTAYFATIPVKAMVKNIKDHGIPASISYTAGTYVCNSVMYDLLYLIDRKYPSIRWRFYSCAICDRARQSESLCGTATMETFHHLKGITICVGGSCRRG